MKPPAARPLPVVLLLALLMLAPGTASTAQEDPNPNAVDETLIVESKLDLKDGERTWVALHRSSVTDDDEPIAAAEGVLYALDAPLMLLYDGKSTVDRIPGGEALALHDGDTVRPVAMQTGPASLLAVGLGDPTATDTSAYLPVGERFDVTAGDYTLALHRYDLAVRPGRNVQAIQRDIAALPYPALIYVEQGEVTATPIGQNAPAAIKQYQVIAADGSSGLDVSDDSAVILVVTLAPAVDATAAGGPSAQINSDTAAPGAPTPTPSATASATATATATVAPTAMPTTASAPDTDGDGLSDADEAARGTNPTSNDSDGDGVFDGYEVSVGLNPTKPDTDGDGVSDYDEVAAETVDPGAGDADGDGLTDGYEGQVSLTNPNDADSDDDGLSDGQEVNTYGSNPVSADTDGDGLNDGADVAAGASPTNRDTDGEGLSDAFEVNQGTSPTSIDSDGDGVDDGYETGRGMNPLSGDSDGDGLGDGEEVNTWGTNPLNPDSDGDEHSDGVEVGCGQDPNTFTDYTGVVAC